MLYVWLAVIVFCLLFELITLNFATISIAAGGLLALLGQAFGFSWWLQLVLFALFSACMLVLLTPFLRAKLLPNKDERDFARRY